MNMRVDPMMQLNEAITSILDAIVYPSVVVLAVVLFVVGALERRAKVRRTEVKLNASDRATAPDRGSRGRSLTVAR